VKFWAEVRQDYAWDWVLSTRWDSIRFKITTHVAESSVLTVIWTERLELSKALRACLQS